MPTSDKRPELRQKVNAFLDGKIAFFYKNIPYAMNLVGEGSVSREWHIRHTIEIILRLRMKRTIDALTIHHFTRVDPILAKVWARYTEDEMLHDAWFMGDLERIGVSRETVYGSEPLLATKLLQGYFYYGFEHENSPLAALCSSYLIEYCSVRTQPDWLKKLGQQEGEGSVRGAQSHVDQDVADDHRGEVWNVIAALIESENSETRMWRHFEALASLFGAFYTELHQLTLAKVEDDDRAVIAALAVPQEAGAYPVPASAA